MSEHTEGPWKIDSFEKTYYYGYHRIEASNERGIADIFWTEDASIEDEANAHLIAAAPDMIEVLKRLEWVKEHAPGGTYFLVCPICGATKGAPHADDSAPAAALAKARGKS